MNCCWPQRVLLTPLILVLTFALSGCSDPDPAAKLRTEFKELKKVTAEVDELLASIDDEARAREVIPQLEEKLEVMRELGWEVSLDKRLTSRSAVTLKNDIEKFREERKARYQEELRRLNRIPNVAELLYPILKKQPDQAEMPKAPGT